MNGYLVAEEGTLAGLTIVFEEGTEWVLGRDPEGCFFVIEDPMVSRKHVICRKTEDGFTLENISAVNPATINGKPIESPTSLREGDVVQIGNAFFIFTLNKPDKPRLESEENAPLDIEESKTIFDESEDLGALTFSGSIESRWILKVISGPNAGAEFALPEGETFIIGKDPDSCDILFQDLSVSRQHAKISANTDGSIIIEDMGSLNKVLINRQEAKAPTQLKSQDLVSLGTTAFLTIDQQQTRETLISPSDTSNYNPTEYDSSIQKTDYSENNARKNWKKMFIPKKHLITAGVFICFIILALGGVVSLFKTQKVEVFTVDESKEIAKSLSSFPELEFSFNPTNGKLFVIGHVMTEIDHQEMIYQLRTLRFINDIEDNVIIDELVWENTNAILTKTPSWRGVYLSSIIPGHFVLRGYVQNIEDSAALVEYINMSFPYLDKLDNQVYVENTLEAQIQEILAQNQFETITFKLSSGELILTGRLPSNMAAQFNDIVSELKKLKGIRITKNFTVLSQPRPGIIDISSRYSVTGSSKLGNVDQYIVINGKILSKGSDLDGMLITNIENNTIFLEKDGVKYKINYNQP